MFVCNFSRDSLMKFLPKGGEIAEVGVAFGAFAQVLKRELQPSRMHLIDPWTAPKPEDISSDKVPAADQATFDQWYHSVQDIFAADIAEDHVRLHKGLSFEVLPEFPESSLDVIYLDGAHDYDGVMKDLELADRTVKPGGFICGHDYSANEVSRDLGFAVVEAVNDFVALNGYHLLAITNESEPSFVIVRDRAEPAAQLCISKLVVSSPTLIEMPDYPTQGTFAQEIYRNGTDIYIVPRFT